MKIVDRDGVAALLGMLRAGGYRVIGPTLRDGAIVYDEIHTVSDLPIGWTDEQAPGSYRVRRRSDEALFGYVVGPTSFKRWLFPPREKLVTLRLPGGGSGEPEMHSAIPTEERLAFLGVRACELRAIQVQDRVFLEGPYVDVRYRARREQVLIVAVNCGQAAATCFCTSMGSGPRVGAGFDLALTERLETARHDFVVEAGSARGAALLASLQGHAATSADAHSVEQVVDRARAQITRRADASRAARDLLYRNMENSLWDDVAARCLACGNCTLACPTCFCSNVEDVTDLSGKSAERWRQWDSCFNGNFSYVVGGAVRGSIKSRYRQWMTHKLAGWHDQFGESGCVGCGRCIAWCPVGIDITEELARLRAQDGAPRRTAKSTEVAP